MVNFILLKLFLIARFTDSKRIEKFCGILHFRIKVGVNVNLNGIFRGLKKR